MLEMDLVFYPATKLATILIKGVEYRKALFFHCISFPGYLSSYEHHQKQEIGNKFKDALANGRTKKIAKKYFGQILHVLFRKCGCRIKTMHITNIAENINIFICTCFETFRKAHGTVVICLFLKLIK